MATLINRLLGRAPPPTMTLPLDFRLGANFTLDELTRSEYAVRKGLNNMPGPAEVEHLRLLVANVLQPVRNALGSLHVSSGYRAPRVNAGVGGARTSHHVRGMAADILPGRPGTTLHDLGAYIQQNLEFTQLIYEFSRWVHVSYDPAALNGEVLEAYKDKGKTRYRPYSFVAPPR